MNAIKVSTHSVAPCLSTRVHRSSMRVRAIPVWEIGEAVAGNCICLEYSSRENPTRAGIRFNPWR